jgi:hypothetical protein
MLLIELINHIMITLHFLIISSFVRSDSQHFIYAGLPGYYLKLIRACSVLFEAYIRNL